MRVMLVNPPAGDNVYSAYSKLAPILPPIGLLSIGAVIQKNGDKVFLIDSPAAKMNYDEVLDVINKTEPSVICLTASTATINSAKKIIQGCKKKNKKIITIIGGPHISLLPKETLLECSDIDFGCVGESELTIKELFEVIKKKRSFNRVKGLVYRKGKRIRLNPPRELIKNLDILPFPAFSLIENIKNYSHTPFRVTGRSFSLITSRGCCYNCKFCDQGVFSRVWRANSPKWVIGMVKKVKSLFDVNFISFEDDDFAVDAKRVIKICRLLIKYGLKIEWGCSLNVKDINEEMLALMKQAGCWNVYLGIESGSQRILDYINKNTQIEDIKSSIEFIKRHKINVYGSFIIGFPTETKSEIEQTLKFSRELPLDAVSYFIYTPYPKTIFYNQLKKKSDTPEEWDKYSGHNFLPIVVNPHLNRDYLLKKQREAYNKFYLRPKYVFMHFGKLSDKNLLKKVMASIKCLFKESIRSIYLNCKEIYY